MTALLGISGSLRAASFNTALLRACAERLAPGNTLSIATLHGVPLYDGDLEAASGSPEAVLQIKAALAQVDGLLIATPEYNNSLPGVLKNAIDWLSRPPGDPAPALRGKPVAVIGATPGGMGTVLAQAAWLPVLRTLGARWYSGGTLYVSAASRVFGADGVLRDPSLDERLRGFLAGFVEFVAQTGGHG